MSDITAATPVAAEVAAPDASTVAPEAAVVAPVEATAPTEVTTPVATTAETTPAETAVVPTEGEAVTAAEPETPALDVDEALAAAVAEQSTTTEPDPNEDVTALVEKVTADPNKAASEIKALRAENAQRRQENTALKAGQTFEGADPEFNDGWRQLGEAFLSDPESVKEVFAELAGVTPAEAATPKTPEEIEAELTSKISDVFQRQQLETARAAQAAVLFTEIKELGYNPEAAGTSDPDGYADLELLRSFIRSQPVGQQDIKAADASVKAFKAAVVEKALNDLKTASTTAPPVNSGTGSAATSAESNSAKPDSADSYEKTVEFYKGRLSGGPAIS